MQLMVHLFSCLMKISHGGFLPPNRRKQLMIGIVLLLLSIQTATNAAVAPRRFPQRQACSAQGKSCRVGSLGAAVKGSSVPSIFVLQAP